MLYFAYGSNMWPPRLEARVGGCRRVASGALAGHRLAFHKSGRDGSGKCDAALTERAQNRVHGVLYELSRWQGLRLDAFEGGYGRTEVEVETVSGERLAAWLYRAHPRHIDPRLRPFDWYKALVLGGARLARLPADYLAVIEAVPAVVDEDPARRAEQRALLAAVEAELSRTTARPPPSPGGWLPRAARRRR